MDAIGLANVVFTLILGAIGLYLAHSLRRQLAERVAEKRLAAYAALWDKMSGTSPVRLTRWRPEPLTKEERQKLFDDFTAWYFEQGYGMLFGGGTRTIFLVVKDNLICPIVCYESKEIREKLLRLSPEEQEKARGYLSIRQLSLLRNRMKADLDVYGPAYHIELDEDDEALLRFCDEDLQAKPWVSRKRQREQACQNVQIFPQESNETPDNS